MSSGRVDATVNDADEDAPATEALPGRKRRFGSVTAERIRARIRANKLLNTTWRVVVAVVGALFLLVGVIMLVTPGPGWLAIIVGFAILASEFVWARRALHRARRAAKAAKDKALDPKVRRRNQILAGSAAALVTAGVVSYLVAFGPMLPWHPEVLSHLP